MSLFKKLEKTRVNYTRNFIELNQVEVNTALFEYCARKGILIPQNTSFKCTTRAGGAVPPVFASWNEEHGED